MLIYDKKSDSIDIYTMEPNKEKLQNYRKRAAKNYKNDLYLCLVRTNCKETVEKLKHAEALEEREINYDHSSVLDYGTWSSISEMYSIKEKTTDTIEKYIAGKYDTLRPTRVYENHWQDGKITEKDRYYLLKPEESSISSRNSHGDIYDLANMLNLPKNLYLLQQLLLGKYQDVVDENISRLLKMFEFEYQINIKIKEIEDMLETGLVSGTVDTSIRKAEIGSKILKKAKQI